MKPQSVIIPCLVAFFSHAAMGSPQTKVHWVKYKSADGGYSVMMPDDAKETTQLDGNGVPNHTATVNREGSTFTAGYTDQPDAVRRNPKENLDRVVRQLETLPNFKLLKRKDFKCLGHSGSDIECRYGPSGAEKYANARWIMVEKRGYALYVEAVGKAPDAALTKRFRESFRLLP